jgi:3-oxoacyl-[acyl-carrier-protein] synthase II
MRPRAEVWITGIGALTPAGDGSGCLRALLRAGESALRAEEAFGCAQVGRIPDGPGGRGGRGGRAGRGLDPAARLFLAAAEEAWRDAGLPPADEPEGERGASGPAGDAACAGDADRSDVVVIEGSSLGPQPHLLESYARRLERLGRATPHPLDLLRFMPGSGGAAFAQAHGLSEVAFQVAAGSVSGALAIGQAYERIAGGQADLVVAGGADAPVQAAIVQAFLAAGVQAPPGSACQPFDARRAGTALADGAGVVVLEAAAHARARGARPRARLLGFGAAAESYGRAAPDPEGAGVVAAVRRALANGVAPRHPDEPGARGGPAVSIDDVAWIKAHGTGTRAGDAAELHGLAQLFGPALADIPVTSLKSAIGHSLGASGATELVAAVLALEDGLVPGTVGWERADANAPACRIEALPGPARPGPVLLLSESFGGRATVLLLEAA